MRGRVALLTLTLLALAPGAAQARPRLLPLVDRAPLSTTHFRDAVITGRRSPVAHAAANEDVAAYPTKEGYSVVVAISGAYATPNRSVAETYVQFLDALPHSSELRKLRVYIAPPPEVESLCGGVPGTLACYEADSQVMVVPGEQTDPANGVTTSYVITHEYAHHIANNRNNAPFNAFAWGPKFWASYEMVCNRAQNHQLFPGDEDANYAANPGEGWAETYAHMKYPDQPWTFSPLMQPDQGAFAAAANDISDLWHHNRVRVFRGRFKKRGSRLRKFGFDLTLDGSLKVSLRGPKRSNYNMTLTSDGGGSARTHRHGSRDRISYRVVCRTLAREHLTVSVHRVSGSGPFRVRVSYAG